MDEPVVLGLDIGGSKTEAWAVAGDTVLRAARFASASVTAAGAEAAAAVLDQVAAHFADLDVAAVCAGAAGADTAGARRNLQEMVRTRFPGARSTAVHDAELVLAAAGLEAGVVLIAGTGSVAWGREASGREARAGGWGYLLGDHGSGYSIATDAVRAVLRDQDEGVAPGQLATALLGYLKLDDATELLAHFYSRPDRSYWAAAANCVLDQAMLGEPTARRIIDAAVSALAQRAVDVTGRLDGAEPVVLAGGLLTNRPDFAGAVGAELAARGMRFCTLSVPPVEGAVHLAASLVVKTA